MAELELLKRAADAIANSKALIITAGAGMGVDSGLPDFRGTEGFWSAYPVIAKLGIEFEDMANPRWLDTDPALAWAFYGHRRNLYRSTRPHRGFERLLSWGQSKPAGYFVFTSNVDGHFQKAGFDPERVMECHGSLEHLQCTKPCTQAIWQGGSENIDIDEVTFRARGSLPHCPFCGSLARPNVLMFGDWSWIHQRTAEQRARLMAWLKPIGDANESVAVVEFGAGTAVPSVRQFSETVAKFQGATLIRFNPRESSVPSGQIGIPMRALEGIEALHSLLGGVSPTVGGRETV